MRLPLLLRSALVSLVGLAAPVLSAAGPRVLPAGTRPDDVRLQPLKDLNGYFPFTPSRTREDWTQRAAWVRRQILVSQGLWPMPTKTPLNAVIHGRIDRGEYTVEKVYFESAPGFFVTGNLYRPKQAAGRVPAVLFAHGHWKDARLSEETEVKLRQEIATGQERFEQGGRSRFQSMCVQLARMGCVVWQWDMLSDSDALQFTAEVIHRFAKQRPEMNAAENWGLFSPQAESHLQSVMGLQTWNAVRSLDFVLGLPEVDPARVAITGASGGGTQTMLLAAIDPRITLAFPAVMVSTAMQGGCTCENSSLLRVNTGNVEFAALFAPKPQGMTTANDWTKEMATKGFPELQKHYELMGAPKNVMLHRGEHFPHNYNAVSRSAFFTWLNRHFQLGGKEPVIERDFEPLSREQLTVWDAAHPAPKASGPDFERALLRWFTTDAEGQLRRLAGEPEKFREVAGGGIEAVIGRNVARAGDVAWRKSGSRDRETHRELTGMVRNATHREEIPVVILRPRRDAGRVVIWLEDAGKAGLFGGDDTLRPAVRRLVDAGVTVVGADLLGQGEFLATGEAETRTRVVANPREAPAYTHGYNHALIAQQAHDVLTVVQALQAGRLEGGKREGGVAIAGRGRAGVVAALARAVAGPSVGRAAIDTGGFRFGQVRDYRDPSFLPGGAKYLDLPGILAAAAPQPLWLAGEGTAALVADQYRARGASDRLVAADGPRSDVETRMAEWLAR
ncbi:MAG: acetylxylan esterase [Verrucomicrobia bacterium]|nr:acetylxylan esterase [Verrucomicrobiota bacterium]